VKKETFPAKKQGYEESGTGSPRLTRHTPVLYLNDNAPFSPR
jgi:hypothetical protein